MSMQETKWRISRCFEERLALDAIRQFIAPKTVPLHSATPWYYFGGVTLFLFVLQVLTGVLLLLYYRPTPSEAYESVQFIMTRVQFGWLVRSVHSWSENLMILSAFIHMFSVVFLHAYRKPRELTWLSGVVLLGLALGFGFSGYLLPWNTVSYFATKVGTDMAASIPWIGAPLGRFLRGGEEVGGATLTRFFGFHVAVLPGLATLLLILHIVLVQKLGISSPPRVEEEHRRKGASIPQMPFFPNFFLRELMAWYAALGVLGSLAAIFPWELGDKADPFATAPAGIRPEWYFLAPFYTLKLIPSHVGFIEGELLGLVGFAVLVLGWVCLPFWGTNQQGFDRMHLVKGVAFALLAYLVTFSLPGVLSMTRLGNYWIGLFLLVILSPLRLEARDSCVECHSALEGSLQTPTQAFSADVHQHRGFGCADCHGGDSSLDDPDAAMSPKRGFLGKIKRTEVPKLCARCHSDASLIHKFRPQQRVDQYAQYQTSVHGKRIAAGDASAANCVDCHSVHDIREVKDSRSPVHPLRLPETCARCHADPAHMAKYKLPTNQFEDYRKSVHWEALAQRGDLSAPSCASCHGNHGATPPQVQSVAAICGTCHALIEDLYSKSPHQPVFAGMGLGGCVVCHGNHAVSRPSDALLAGPNAVCSQCHDESSAGGMAGAEMARGIAGLQAALKRSDDVLGVAKRSGLEVSEALLRLQEGRESLIKARVAVHNFQVAFVNKPVSEGLTIASETYHAGEEAMGERRFRRLGLAFSLLTIAATIVGLWLAVQSIERKSQGA